MKYLFAFSIKVCYNKHVNKRNEVHKMKLIILFAVLQFVNVFLSTIRSIVVVKGKPFAATLANTVYFSFYTIIVVLTAADFSLWVKVGITAITNLIGTMLSKKLMEHLRKDKLWRIEATVTGTESESLTALLKINQIPFSTIAVSNGYVVYFIYSESQAVSTVVKELLTEHNAKYFISEGKEL